MGKLAGKVAIVTGGGRGIGRSTSLKLAAEGAKVIVNDLDEEPASAVVKAIRQAGGTAVTCVGSVIENGFPECLIETTLQQFSGLDILINNAGYAWDSRIEDATDEQLDAMYEVHIKAQFRILRAAINPIKDFATRERAQGRLSIRKVVNVSSISGTCGSPTQSAYSIAKSAVVGLTRTLAKDWGRYGVCVNCVAFGVIGTRLTVTKKPGKGFIDVDGHHLEVGVEEGTIEGLTALIPLGRVGTPEDAANGIYLLCIPESDYVTGQLLTVAGGLRI
jgi:3-oxoacyl-[acyl-carrier protein] reductase